MRTGLTTKIVLTFSLITLSVWVATIAYTFPTVSGMMGKASVAGESAGEAFAVFRRNILLAGIGGTLFSLVVGWFVSRQIIKPLLLLSSAMKEAEQGNLKAEVRVQMRDELGDLGQSFNTMLRQLAQLAEKVNKASMGIDSLSAVLGQGIDEATGAEEQVAGAVEQVARGAEDQVQSIEDASRIINEIAQGVEQVAVYAQNVSLLAKEASTSAESGSAAIQRAVSQMQTISETVNSSALTVQKLGERSQEVGQIVDTITGIADQTNLLALNAAIEAARAGEQGRGFAVVAEEVRKLAEQSATAAKQIGRLIKGIQAETLQAVQAMNNGTREVKNGIEVISVAGKAFGQIDQAIRTVSGQVDEVSAASQQMAAGGREAVQTIGSIASVASETAVGAAEVAASVQEVNRAFQEGRATASKMKEMSRELRELVARMKT